MKRTPCPEVTAHHEAGHAVVAQLLGLNPERVDLEPEDDFTFLGRTRCSVLSPKVLTLMAEHGEAYARRVAAYNVAGQVAEKLAGLRKRHNRKTSDYTDAWYYLEETGTVTGRESRAYNAEVQRAEQLATDVLKLAWPAVGALVQLLLTQGTALRTQLVEIVYDNLAEGALQQVAAATVAAEATSRRLKRGP